MQPKNYGICVRQYIAGKIHSESSGQSYITAYPANLEVLQIFGYFS